MKWRIPETEDAWEECLSSYLDGEMSQEDISELEKFVNANPERFAQMEKLKKTSDMLHEWKIDAPAPDAAFIREVRKQAAPKDGLLTRWGRSLRVQAVVPSFLIGLLAGIVFMSIAGKDNSQVTTPMNRPEYLRAEYTISQSQANMLFAEADAEMLKLKLLNALNTSDFKTVHETYEELKTKYPESRALRGLSGNRKLRFL